MTLLSRLRLASGYPRQDGIHAALLFAGACIGLFLLTLWSKTLGPQTIPPILETVVPWQASNVRPEQAEHTLFLLGFFLVPLCSLGTWLCFRRSFLQKNPDSDTRVAAAFAGIVLIIWLGTLYSMHGSLLDTTSNWYAQPWMKLFPLNITSILSMVLATTFLFLQPRWKNFSLPYPLAWEIGGIGLLILFLAYDPLSLLSYQPKEPGDDMWFIMPAWDVLHGKHLLVGTEAQYGLGIFYILALFFKLFGTSVQSFHGIEIGAHILYYTLLYILIRSICQTRRGAVIAFLCILGGTIFRNELRFETYAEPSMTRIRNFWDVPVFLAFYKNYQTRNHRWFVVACILATIAFLYNSDIGLSLTIITFVWAAALPFFTESSVGSGIKKIAKRVGTFLAILACGVGLFTLLLRGLSGAWPDWSLNFYYVSLYLAGFGGMPIPVVGAYWLVLGIEMAAIITDIAGWLIGRPAKTAPLLLMFGLYGFLSFNYYLNRSFISNLWSVSLPACLSGLLLMQAYMNRSKDIGSDTMRSPVIRYPLTVLAGLCIGINLWMVGAGTVALAKSRYTPDPASIPSTDPVFAAKMKDSVALIQKYVPPNDSAAVISHSEALFLLESDRASAFHVPMLEMAFTVDKLNEIVTKFLAENHPYLFVEEHSTTRCPMCDTLRNGLLPGYMMEGSGGLLTVYRRKE